MRPESAAAARSDLQDPRIDPQDPGIDLQDPEIDPPDPEIDLLGPSRTPNRRSRTLGSWPVSPANLCQKLHLAGRTYPDLPEENGTSAKQESGFCRVFTRDHLAGCPATAESTCDSGEVGPLEALKDAFPNGARFAWPGYVRVPETCNGVYTGALNGAPGNNCAGQHGPLRTAGPACVRASL